MREIDDTSRRAGDDVGLGHLEMQFRGLVDATLGYI
jgi:hypothetical protein